MKNGKRPTLQQKKALEYVGLNADNWLVFKVDTRNNELHITHRELEQTKVIPA